MNEDDFAVGGSSGKTRNRVNKDGCATMSWAVVVLVLRGDVGTKANAHRGDSNNKGAIKTLRICRALEKESECILQTVWCGMVELAEGWRSSFAV